MEEKKKEVKKGNSNKTAIIIACICGGLLLLFVFCFFMLPLFLVANTKIRVIQQTDQIKQEMEEKQKEINEKIKEETRPATEEDELYTSEAGGISCDTKTRKLVYISYKDFDDSKLTNDDVCNTYVIEKYNIKVIPEVLVLENDEVDFAKWKIVANEKDEEVPYYGYLKIRKYKNYLVISPMMLAGGYESHYIYDDSGNLKTKIDAFDSNNCAYITTAITENSFILYQHYYIDGGVAASESCPSDSKVIEKCGNNYKEVKVSYELADNNGLLSLKELSNYECR